MFPSRILVALAASIASSLAIAQATPSTAPAAPATAPNSQRAPGKASATPGAGAQGSGSAAGKAPKSAKDGTQRRQLQQLYAGVMTEDEKIAYRNKVREVKTYDQCKALLEETHKAMEPRAKAKGTSIAQSPTEACDQAKARGRLKS